MKKLLSWPVLAWLKFWARIALKKNKPDVIGVTGSVGKSSVRNAIYAVLKDYFPTKMVEKGNSETGIPLGILGIKTEGFDFGDWLKAIFKAPFGISFLRGTKYLIVEMAVDEPTPPKNMDYLLTIVKPDLAIFLNVYPVHTQQFKSIKAIAEQKGKIFNYAKICIYNMDNENVKCQMSNVKSNQKSKKELLSFGKEKTNDISYGSYEGDFERSMFIFRIGHEELRIKIKYLLPEEYQEVFAPAILVGKALGLSINKIIKGLEKNFYLPSGRASVFAGINNSIVIDSSYNASKKPVLSLLKLVKNINKDHRPFVFVFGDMRELGRQAENEHKAVLEEINNTVDYLYCVGELTKKYILPYSNKKIKEIKWFESSFALGKYLKDHLPANSIVLVKGSQNFIFLEEAVKLILKNKSDEKHLCRQSHFWLEKKTRLFSNILR